MTNTGGTSYTVTGATYVVCSVTVRSELSSAVRLMTPCRIEWAVQIHCAFDCYECVSVIC